MAESEEPVIPVVPPDQRLVSYFKAGYPLLYMVTSEEGRAEAQIGASALGKNANGKSLTGKEVLYVWSATDGLFAPFNKEKDAPKQNILEPTKALAWVKSEQKRNRVYIFRDLHAFFNGGAGILCIRLLRDLARELQNLQSTLIIVSPVAKLPPELTREVVQIDFALPDREQVTGLFERIYQGNKKGLEDKNLGVDVDQKERIVSAALGLTSVEVTNAFAMAMVDAVAGRGQIADLVLKEKALAVKKTGLLEYYEKSENINSIGGLENLKVWLQRRSKAFTKKARDFGLPLAKGALLVGIPGGGKSLSAKAAAAIMQVPLIRFDIARVFGGLVGQSEEQMRTALATIDAIGPCVVWLDEMEKAFAGASGSGANDSGVTRRVFGNFLTWMQEKTTPSFVMATANSIIGIPPELLRKGRFDENFLIPLPGPIARAEIVKIQLRKQKRDKFPIDVKTLVEGSRKMTGAEIEAAVTEGLFTAFEHDRDLTTDDVLDALKAINPISVSQKDELDAMLKWATDNAVNASRMDSDDPQASGPVGRQLKLDQ